MDHIQLLLDHQSLLDHRFVIGQGQPSLSMAFPCRVFRPRLRMPVLVTSLPPQGWPRSRRRAGCLWLTEWWKNDGVLRVDGLYVYHYNASYHIYLKLKYDIKCWWTISVCPSYLQAIVIVRTKKYYFEGMATQMSHWCLVLLVHVRWIRHISMTIREFGCPAQRRALAGGPNLLWFHIFHWGCFASVLDRNSCIITFLAKASWQEPRTCAVYND